MGKSSETASQTKASVDTARARSTSLAADAGGDGARESGADPGPQAPVVDGVRAVVAEVDASGRVLSISGPVEDLLGYPAGAFLGKRSFDVSYAEDERRGMAESRAILDTGLSPRSVYRARHKAGHWIWVEALAHPFPADDGTTHTYVFIHEVTALKQEGDALRDREQRYRTLMKNASDVIAEVDTDGCFQYVTPNCLPILGLEPESIVGRKVIDAGIAERIHPDDRDRLLAATREHQGLGATGRIDYRYRLADGTWHWFESRARWYRRHDGALRMVVVSRDVDERVKAQNALLESEARYRVVAETARDLIMEMDGEGRLLYASPTLEPLLGYAPEELQGTTPFHLVHSDDVESIVGSFLESFEASTSGYAPPHRIRHRDGSWRWFEAHTLTYRRADGEQRFVAVSRDVTDRRRQERARRALEKQMQQAQKFEGLGVMAGGIAHDFNNLLTPVLGDARLAFEDTPEDSPARRPLLRIQNAARRAAVLTQQMRAYAGRETLLTEPVDLSMFVRTADELLTSAAGVDTVFVYELAPDLPPVEVDPAQLRLVLMSLVRNAAESAENGAVRIAIRTGIVEFSAEHPARAALGDHLPAGVYVYLEVSDDGCGMDAETVAQIFDPFFSTKFTGRGLGLSAVLGIVRGHFGAIEVESARGRGARFRVLLPAAVSDTASLEEAETPVGWRGSGAVLVVDDDDGVRELAADILRRAGLTVHSATDGREALAQLRSRASEIRAVVLDLTMPGLSGTETFEELRRIAPDLPVVLVSGYDEEHAARRFGDRRPSAFLQKPFLPSALLAAVRDIFEPDSATGD